MTTEISAINKVRQPGCIGIDIPFGKLLTQESVNASGNSYEMAKELMGARSALSVTRVAPILAQSLHGSSPASIGAFANVMLAGAVGDPDTAWDGNNASTGFNFNNGINQGVTLNAAETVTRRRYLIGDFVTLTPKARTDGGADRPIAVGHAYLGTGGVAMVGESGLDLTNWATRSSGLVRMRKNATIGDQTSATALWGSAVSYSPIIGFAYASLTPIVNVMGFGDSLDDEQAGGVTYQAEPVSLLACEAINGMGLQSTTSYANLAWSGQNTDNILNNFKDAIGAGLVPDLAIFPIGSPNSIVLGQPITTTIIATWRAYLTEMMEICALHGICPILRPVYPVNYSVHQWGSTDALRIAWNAEIKALCLAGGIIFLDDTVVVNGAVEGHGQMELSATMTTDGIHLNDVGKAAILTSRTNAILGAIGDCI